MADASEELTAGEGEQELAAVFLHLRPKDIVRIKFTIESYEGLGVVRTLCRQRAEIVVLTPACLERQVVRVLESLRSEVNYTLLSKPMDLSGDWLLREEM